MVGKGFRAFSRIKRARRLSNKDGKREGVKIIVPERGWVPNEQT